MKDFERDSTGEYLEPEQRLDCSPNERIPHCFVYFRSRIFPYQLVEREFPFPVTPDHIRNELLRIAVARNTVKDSLVWTRRSGGNPLVRVFMSYAEHGHFSKRAERPYCLVD